MPTIASKASPSGYLLLIPSSSSITPLSYMTLMINRAEDDDGIHISAAQQLFIIIDIVRYIYSYQLIRLCNAQRCSYLSAWRDDWPSKRRAFGISCRKISIEINQYDGVPIKCYCNICIDRHSPVFVVMAGCRERRKMAAVK